MVVFDCLGFVSFLFACISFLNNNNFNQQSENGDDGSIHSNDSANNNMEVIFLGPNGNNNQSSLNRDITTNNRYPNKYSSCKTLQRKLELKVERAKRNYSQQNGGEMIQVRTDPQNTYLFIFDGRMK